MSRKLIVENLKELRHEYLGCGCNGECYLTKDNMVFKELFDFIDSIDFYDYRAEKRIITLSEFQSPVFVFPEVLVYKNRNSRLIGYLMRYADGNILINLDGDESILEYINALTSVEKEVVNISKEKIKINDSSAYNIIYTKSKTLEIIDTDFYDISKNDDNLYRRNLYNVSFGVLYPFLGTQKFDCFVDPKINKLCSYVNGGLIRPSEFLCELLEIFNGISFKCDTVNELNNCLKLVRRDNNGKEFSV